MWRSTNCGHYGKVTENIVKWEHYMQLWITASLQNVLCRSLSTFSSLYCMHACGYIHKYKRKITWCNYFFSIHIIFWEKVYTQEKLKNNNKKKLYFYTETSYNLPRIIIVMYANCDKISLFMEFIEFLEPHV